MKSDSEPVIEVTDLVRKFGERRVINDISFKVDRGETMIIMGGSGCGKSTLLRHIVGVMKPTSGSVKIFGEEITTMNDREVARGAAAFRHVVSIRRAARIAHRRRECRAAHGPAHRLKPEEIDEIVKLKLQMVGLTGFENLKPAEISGGMKKRVGLARALALDPELLFSDEPTSGLDPIMAAVVDKLTLELTRGSGMTAVVVTHDMTSAFRIGTRMIMLEPRQDHRSRHARRNSGEPESRGAAVHQRRSGWPRAAESFAGRASDARHVQPRPLVGARNRFHRKTP